MAKLTKAQAKLHEKAVKLLQCKELSEADTRFVFDHYREDANHINSTAGAFLHRTDWPVTLGCISRSITKTTSNSSISALVSAYSVIWQHMLAIVITSAVWKSHALKSIKIM